MPTRKDKMTKESVYNAQVRKGGPGWRDSIGSLQYKDGVVVWISLEVLTPRTSGCDLI